MTEIIKQPPKVTHILTSNTSNTEAPDIGMVIDCERFGSKLRLLRVTAYVMRFICQLKRRIQADQSGDETRKPDELSAHEILEAEKIWIRQIQGISFKEELKFLTSKRKTLPPPNVSQFGLYIETDGLMKCRGRVDNASIPETGKRPILLPAKHHFTDLVVQGIHRDVKHSGINHTFSTLRERFWVLRGRETAKRNLRKCVICRRYEGKPYNAQPIPALPRIRVDDAPPFVNTGLDFLGPLYVAEGNKAMVESTSKVYVCLYTYASTRAIHLELTHRLSVQAFLLSFRRFVSRQGVPANLISDNASTFKSASKEVKGICRSEEIQKYLANRGVTWQFIVEKAPWLGGFWERLVRSVKRVLKRIVGRSTLNYDELHTLLLEIESIINSRPITYLYLTTRSPFRIRCHHHN